MRFPVSIPRAVVLSPESLALGCTTQEALRQAQALAGLLGPAYNGQDGTTAYADLVAAGATQGLTRLRSRLAIDEAFLNTATVLLGDWESMLGLPRSPGVPTSVRRQRLLARWRALRGGTPQAIRIAVAALLDPGVEPVIVENVVQDAPFATPTAVFRFAIVLPDTGPAWRYFMDGQFASSVRATVDAQKPAHTSYAVTNRVGFRCDDPQSVTDLTVLAS